MRCKFDSVFAILLLSQFITVGVSANQLAFSDRLQLSVKAEVETIHKLEQRIRSGDRSVCEGYRGPDMSGCARHLFSNFRPHSALGLRAVLDASVTAAIKDREMGFDDKRISLILADNVLTVTELVQPRTFFASRVHARTRVDRAQKVRECRNEELILRQFIRQLPTTLKTHFAKNHLAIDRPPDIDGFRARLDLLMRKTWRLI